MKFTDLKFEKCSIRPSYFVPFAPIILGQRAKANFPNGYTVSVILGNENDDSYSNGVDTYEVGVVNRNAGLMAEDLGYKGIYKYATKEDIDNILVEVEALPEAPNVTEYPKDEHISEEAANALIEAIKGNHASIRKVNEELDKLSKLL